MIYVLIVLFLVEFFPSLVQDPYGLGHKFYENRMNPFFLYNLTSASAH